jgi:hypothetical protein
MGNKRKLDLVSKEADFFAENSSDFPKNFMNIRKLRVIL